MIGVSLGRCGMNFCIRINNCFGLAGARAFGSGPCSYRRGHVAWVVFAILCVTPCWAFDETDLQKLKLVKKTGENSFDQKELLDVKFVPLLNKNVEN